MDNSNRSGATASSSAASSSASPRFPPPAPVAQFAQSLVPRARQHASSFLSRCLQMTPWNPQTLSNVPVVPTTPSPPSSSQYLLNPPLTRLELNRLLTRREWNMYLPDDVHTNLAESLSSLFAVTTSLFAKLYVINLPVVQQFLAQYPIVQVICLTQLHPLRLIQRPLLAAFRPLQWILTPFSAMAVPLALNLTVQRGLAKLLNRLPSSETTHEHPSDSSLTIATQQQNQDRQAQRERIRQRIKERRRKKRTPSSSVTSSVATGAQQQADEEVASKHTGADGIHESEDPAVKFTTTSATATDINENRQIQDDLLSSGSGGGMITSMVTDMTNADDDTVAQQQRVGMKVTSVTGATPLHTEHPFNTQTSLVTAASVPSQDRDWNPQTQVEEEIPVKSEPKIDEVDARVRQVVDIDADDEAADNVQPPDDDHAAVSQSFESAPEDNDYKDTVQPKSEPKLEPEPEPERVITLGAKGLAAIVSEKDMLARSLALSDDDKGDISNMYNVVSINRS